MVAEDAAIAEVTQACRETGVQMLPWPVFLWSSPDEQERRAQTCNWRRMRERVAAELKA